MLSIVPRDHWRTDVNQPGWIWGSPCARPGWWLPVDPYRHANNCYLGVNYYVYSQCLALTLAYLWAYELFNNEWKSMIVSSRSHTNMRSTSISTLLPCNVDIMPLVSGDVEFWAIGCAPVCLRAPRFLPLLPAFTIEIRRNNNSSKRKRERERQEKQLLPFAFGDWGESGSMMLLGVDEYGCLLSWTQLMPMLSNQSHRQNKWEMTTHLWQAWLLHCCWADMLSAGSLLATCRRCCLMAMLSLMLAIGYDDDDDVDGH